MMPISGSVLNTSAVISRQGDALAASSAAAGAAANTASAALSRAILIRLPSSSERFRAGDDLDQLLGDIGLALAVVAQRQLPDQIAGIARGRVHGAHLGAVEAGLVLEQRLQDLAI